MVVQRHVGQRSDRRAFTLVELLVAVFILGILLSGLAALTSGFLGFSRQVSVINDRLADLNDAMGYVSLTARSSMLVYGQAGLERDVEFATDAPFTCSVQDATRPCIAFVVPSVERASGAITGFDFVAYAVRPLSEWARNPGVPGGWDQDDTPVLLEYRAELCSPCATPPVVDSASAVVMTRESLVIANLILEDEAGVAYAPFTVGAGASRITVQLRTRGSGVTDGVQVPSRGVLTQLVVRRP